MNEVLNIKIVGCIRRLILGYYIPVMFVVIIQFFKPLSDRLFVIVLLILIIGSFFVFKAMNSRSKYIYQILKNQDVVTVKYLSWFKKRFVNIDIKELSIELFYKPLAKKPIHGFFIKMNSSIVVKQYIGISMDGSEWDEELILKVYNQLTELKKNYLKELENTREHDGSSAS